MNHLHLRSRLGLQNKVEAKNFVATGIIAGIIAGIFMAILLMIWSASVGEGVLFPVQLVAGVVYGVDVILGGPMVVITGLVIHLLVSAALGVGFAYLFRPESRFSRFQLSQKQLVVNGLIYGVAVWVAMTLVVLPLFNMTMRERVAQLPAVWFFVHVMYGVVLGALPSMLRALSGRAVERTTVAEIRTNKAA